MCKQTSYNRSSSYTNSYSMSPAELDEKTGLQDHTTPLDPANLLAELEYYKNKCRELEQATGPKEEPYDWGFEPEPPKKRGHDIVWLFVPNLIGTARYPTTREKKGRMSNRLNLKDTAGCSISMCSSCGWTKIR